jgi:hypothetical protein
MEKFKAKEMAERYFIANSYLERKAEYRKARRKRLLTWVLIFVGLSIYIGFCGWVILR